MNNAEQNTSQPQRELEWLARYYCQHGHHDKAGEIFKHLSDIRSRAADLVGVFEIYKESA